MFKIMFLRFLRPKVFKKIETPSPPLIIGRDATNNEWGA
ncbi:hypothetical protein BY457_102161 [Marinilabilia salmonicolor]|jgi:hypothetical protein|nr:hypothetical protein BY457_102161 [Marinilabilia salmonicolor]